MQLSSAAVEIKRFIELQILDMQWLDEYVSSLLWRSGLDPTSPLGTTSQLIVSNIVRLTILLMALSTVRCVLNRGLESGRCRNALFGRGIGAALSGAAAGAFSLEAAEASLPSRLARLAGRGMAPEAVSALLFTAPFADPFTFPVLLTLAFGVWNALICTLSGGALAVLGGMLVGRIWRQSRRSAEENVRDAGNAAAGPADVPGLRTLPGKTWAEIHYIFPYIMLGAGAGAFIRNWVPESWIQTVLGTADPRAVCLAVVAGIPLGADLFCLLPIVVELQSKGAHPGVLTAFVLSATAFTPSALFAFGRAASRKLLLLIYVLCLIWAAGIGCLLR